MTTNRLLRRRRVLARSSRKPTPVPKRTGAEAWLVIIGTVFGIVGVAIGHIEPGFLIEVIR